MHASGLKQPVVPSYFDPDAHHSGPSATRPRTFSAPSCRLPPPESSEASELAISSRYQPHLWDYSLSILSFLTVTCYCIITPQNALLGSPVLVLVNRDYIMITHSIITPLKFTSHSVLDPRQNA